MDLAREQSRLRRCYHQDLQMPCTIVYLGLKTMSFVSLKCVHMMTCSDLYVCVRVCVTESVRREQFIACANSVTCVAAIKPSTWSVCALCVTFPTLTPSIDAFQSTLCAHCPPYLLKKLWAL